MVTTTYMIIEGDSRLTNARTPTSHASTHGFSGSDPLPQASVSQSGLLASTDFATFNNKADASTVSSHINNTSNPHSVTAAQIGLGNCNNTSDANKPISTATQTALNAKQATLPTAFLYMIPPNANLAKSSKDSDGVYLVYTWTLTTAVSGYPAKWVSTLSSDYLTRTMVVYDSNQTTVLATYTFTRTLDSDGNLVSEVLNSS